jgi:predicted nucleic acid-binding protein
MAGFLLDTSVLIGLVDPKSPFHEPARKFVDGMSSSDLQFVSVITLGEITTGVASVQRVHGRTPINAIQTLAQARDRDLLIVDIHVAEAYAALKSVMVSHFMRKSSRAKRSEHLEDWIDHATGKRLNVTENDLWICAQGFDRDLHIVSCDGDFARVREAEPRLKLTLLREP